jgi:uncharacterized membrane protein
MISKLTSNNWAFYPTNGLRVLIAVLLVLGVFFRLANLDLKVYWEDEAFTSLRISGYTETELLQQVFNGHEIGVEDLQKYQRTNPEKSVIDTIKGLAVEEPQHTPLYFVMVRLWVQSFGNSVAVTRSLSVLISLLVFPCIYWLCRELFELPPTGWVAVALMAVSPFHVVYAQEAREYSLWTVTILLSSAALLRAMRLKTKLSWGLYAATMVLALYSYLFSIFVAIGHGIYVVVIERFRLSKTVTAYLLASLVGFLAFSPWLVIVTTNWYAAAKTTHVLATTTVSRFTLLKALAHCIRTPFIDLGIGSYQTPLILILIGYSLYFLCRNTPKYICLFILTLIGVTTIALILPDFILGTERLLVGRYLIPFYLGIQLAVAHLLASQIISASLSQRKIWQAIMAVLISVGVVSCAMISSAELPLSKLQNGDNHQIAHIINQANRPLVISDMSDPDNHGYLLSLSYSLNPKVRFRLVINPRELQIPDGFSDIFLYQPGKALREELKHNYKVEPVPIEPVQQKDKLWRLAKE